MSKISLILITMVGIFGLISCEKDETKAVSSSNPTKPAFTNLTEGAVIVLNKADIDVPIEYKWSKSDFGFQASVNYFVQIDKQGNDFKEPVNLGSSNNLGSISLLTGDLNNKLLAMEMDPSDPKPLLLEFRVKASVSDAVDPVYSNVVTQTITPFYIPIVYPVLHVPGSYQGWNPADTITVIASLKSDGKYEGYLWFGIDNAMFKYTETPSWDVNWGDNGNDGSIEKNGSDIPAGLAGYYKLNVDLNAKTHSYARTDWGIIGSATPNGWDSDQNLTYNSATSTWTITLALVVGEIKFRANDDWAINYGDGFKDASPPVAATGFKLMQGGDNIPIAEAGNYTISIDLSQPVYKYKIVKN